MKNVLWIVAGFMVVGLFVISTGAKDGEKSFDLCVVKGISFYKDAGIVGRFNSGRTVVSVVEQDCQKNHKSFDN